MKRLLCFTALVLSCLCGCSNRYDQEAIDIYLDATQNLKETDSLHIGVLGNIYGDADKEMLNAKVNLDADMIIKDKLQAAMNFNISLSGVALGDMGLYVKDNTLYLNIINDKIKMPFQEYIDQMGPTDQNNFNTTADEDTVKKLFKEFKFKDKKAGIIAFQFDLAMFDDITSTLNYDIQLKDMIKSYGGTMNINDNRLTEMTFDMLINVEGKDYPITFTVTFSKVNEVTEIKFPDFKDYKQQNIPDSLDVEM